MCVCTNSVVLAGQKVFFMTISVIVVHIVLLLFLMNKKCFFILINVVLIEFLFLLNKCFCSINVVLVEQVFLCRINE